jgi:FkbM family methyltransferase
MVAIARTLQYIVQHPLNRNDRFAAVGRFVRWQVSSRLLPGAVAIPFVDSTRLLVSRGMTGATGNLYCGLHEYEDMAFVLHALRPDDLFIDVGANIGSYTVLAAGAVGARTISCEPIPTTYRHLLDNVRLNNLEPLVQTRNVAIGSSAGNIPFSSGLDTMNHALSPGEKVEGVVNVPVAVLDTLLAQEAPVVMKIDVEGYETEVLNGATETMRHESLLAVLIELNGSGERYGYSDRAIHERLVAWGFSAAVYAPARRELRPIKSKSFGAGNTLYVRDADLLQERVRDAPRFKVQWGTV